MGQDNVPEVFLVLCLYFCTNKIFCIQPAYFNYTAHHLILKYIFTYFFPRLTQPWKDRLCFYGSDVTLWTFGTWLLVTGYCWCSPPCEGGGAAHCSLSQSRPAINIRYKCHPGARVTKYSHNQMPAMGIIELNINGICRSGESHKLILSIHLKGCILTYLIPFRINNFKFCDFL